MADPWLVTPGERVKHEEQFTTLRPINGFITGDQAKGFFLQSRLPPPVLGIIWALSDVDGDGKMDLHEFSIACKLINLKLRGFNLPQTLPAALKQSACGGTGATAAAAAVPGVAAPLAPSSGSGTPTGSGTPGTGAPGTVGVVSGVAGLGSGPSVTPAMAPGPVVSPIAMPTPVAPSSDPILIPVASATVSAPTSVTPSLSSDPGTSTSGPISVPGPPLTPSMAPLPGSAPSTVPGELPSNVSGMPLMAATSSVPSAMPGMVSGIMPGMVSGAIPGVTMPGTVSGAIPSVTMPGMVSGAVPGVTMPGMVSGAMPNVAMSGMVSGAMPGVVYGSAVPGAIPGNITGVMPGAVLGSMSGMGSFTTSVPPIRGVPMPGMVPPTASVPQTMGATQVPIAPIATAPILAAPMPVAPVASAPMTAAPVPAAPMAAAPMTAAPMTAAPIAAAPMMPQSTAPIASQPQQVSGGIPPISGAGVQMVGPSAAPVASPAATAASTAGAAVHRSGSQDSSGSQTPGEWAVPQASKLKFTQVFNMTDRTKSGYLSGVQARNILIQSHLPQQILAQIWALSDVDNDGRLSSEEFVLAMYLCESSKAGNKLPSVLPPELIPPTNRRQRTSSVHSSGSAGTPVADVLGGLINDNTFEDKRRENFEKGQAELERRRKALLDAQRRETEERLRREREEEAKREKARLEAERRRQEELEREMHRQREMESQREQERQRQEEMKEQARKDAEVQRQQEWEKQRLQELMNVRQRQQENLLSLKAKNQSLQIELTTKEDRVKELTQKISETRQGVTEVKATIDTMRSTRDTYMGDMNQLKASARDQNQRLLNLNQEKARLKARNTAAAGAAGADQAAVDASLTSKQMVIKQLQEKVEELEKELSTKEEDVNNNISDLTHLKDDLHATADRCAEIYKEYSSKRQEVLQLREKLVNPDAAWGDDARSSWAEKPEQTGKDDAPADDAVRYRALYQFDARNHDELSFMPGDVITLTTSEVVEPGWLGGEIRGQTGWFPEAYCERLERVEGVTETMVKTHLENIPEENVVATGAQQTMGEAVAIFPWRAKQNNHLSFNKGDRIAVREQQDQWWFGQLNNTGGWFPRSFVRMVSGPAAVTSPVTTPQEAPEEPPMPENLVHDEVSEFYEALYPFQSGEPGDLTFVAGEIILVVKKEGDWWHGVVSQRSGIFPSNYVQILPNQLITTNAEEKVVGASDSQPLKTEMVSLEETQAEPQQETVTTQETEEPAKPASDPATVQTPDSATLKVNQEVEQFAKSPKSPKGGKGKKPEIASVIAPYDATSSNQLSLQRGQLVMIRKKTASGWWEGELQAKGKKRQIGWFPASYVKVLGGSSRSTPVSMELTNREDAPPDDVTTPPTSVPLITQVTVTPPADDPMDGQNDASNGFAEQVEALYPYTAMNDDELTFEAGAIISVIDKEDAAWWKGTLEGAIGVFPSNYVQPYKGFATATTAGSPEEDLCYQREKKTSRSDSSDSKTSWNFSLSSPIEQKRQSVIEEIIRTEATYLSELLLVDEAFIKPMRASTIVSEKELDLLFANWNELILANSYFNKVLKVRCKNSTGGLISMIGDVLCQQIAQLTPYLRFCSVQIRGATLLGEKCGSGGAWVDLVKQCQEHPAVRGLTLTSFLLKPMQRITKYPLLIQQLLKYTPEGHPDHHNTQEALTSASTLCAQVNEAVSQRDNTDKLEWMQRQVLCEGLQERLVFNSLTNTLGPRKLLHIGVLHKSKSRRELVAFLLSDFLLLTTPHKSVSSCSTLAALERALTTNSCTMYRKPLFLTEMKVEADKDSDLGYTVSSQSCGDVAVAAPTSHERNNWLKKIAIAQKHIADTERSILHRQQSKEKDQSIMGRVLVTVMAGVSLYERQDSGILQSFCEVSLGSQAHRTSTATSPHPKWDSTMQFLVKDLAEDVLCITVYEKGYFKPNEFLGRTEIRIHQVHEESRSQPGAQPHLYKLKLEEVKSGEVILKISLQLFDRS